MSYVKLGSVKVNTRSYKSVRDKLIVSQVIDSGSSYESPKLIRSEQDLQLYYGNSFKEYNYFRELLSKGITLYLHKPISSEIDSSRLGDLYIDLDNTQKFVKPEEGVLLYSFEYELPKDGLIKTSNYGFAVGSSQSSYEIYYWAGDRYNHCSPLDFTGTIFSGQYMSTGELPLSPGHEGEINGELKLFNVVTDGSSEWYVYLKGSERDGYVNEYINVKYLPQVLSNSDYLTSKLNRDTLCINRKDWLNINSISGDEISFYNPKYHTRTLISCSYNEDYIKDSQQEEHPEYLINLRSSFASRWKDFKNKQCNFCYLYDFKNTKVDDFRGSYIVIETPDNGIYSKRLIWCGLEGDPLPLGDNIIPGASVNSIRVQFLETSQREEDRKNMISGYISAIQGTEGSDPANRYKVYSLGNFLYRLHYLNYDLTNNTGFYKLPGLLITGDDEADQNFLAVISSGNSRIEFFSKTIGKGDSNIKINIKKVDSDSKEKYQITISRYSYTEIFIGNLYSEEKNSYGYSELLEYSINQESKLVTCMIHKSYTNSSGEQINYNYENEEDGLFEGTYILSRAKIENPTAEYRRNSLQEMSRESSVKEDFLLIPSLDQYRLAGDIEESLNEVNDFLLDYSNKKNCQCLIVNTSRTISEEGGNVEGDYYYNKITDYDNYLVYFYNDLSIYGNDRPGYYSFIEGINRGRGTFSTDEIIYDVPDKTLAEMLKSKKCNYLSCNKHEFYYSTYFSHTGDWKYDKTILMRFAVSHTTKTIERELHRYLSSVYSSEFENGIQEILNKILADTSIIKSATLTKIKKDITNQSIYIYVSITIRELVDKDTSLDLILNYNLN